jgi:hypothetical protein
MYGPVRRSRGPGRVPAAMVRWRFSSWYGIWLPAVIPVVTPKARYSGAPAFSGTAWRIPPK